MPITHETSSNIITIQNFLEISRNPLIDKIANELKEKFKKTANFKFISNDIGKNSEMQKESDPNSTLASKLSQIGNDISQKQKFISEDQSNEEAGADYDIYNADQILTIDNLLQLHSEYENEREQLLQENKFLNEIEDRYFVFNFTKTNQNFGDADISSFSQFFCDEFKVTSDSIIDIELRAGSLVYSICVEYNPKYELYNVEHQKNEARQKNEAYQKRKFVKENKSKYIKNLKEKHEKEFKVEIISIDAPSQFNQVMGNLKSKRANNQSNFYFTNIKKQFGGIKVAQIEINQMIEKSRLNLKLVGINEYNNPSYETKFFKSVKPGANMKYLVHGCYTKDKHHDLVYSGFSNSLVGSTDIGFFGKGFYLTSYIDYALCYQFRR